MKLILQIILKYMKRCIVFAQMTETESNDSNGVITPVDELLGPTSTTIEGNTQVFLNVILS